MYCNVITKIYHVNEPLYYNDFSEDFITWNLEGCLSDLLQVFPTYIHVEVLWDISLKDGQGCLLKKIIIDDEIAEKIDIPKRLSEINLKDELQLYMKVTSWDDTKYKGKPGCVNMKQKMEYVK